MLMPANSGMACQVIGGLIDTVGCRLGMWNVGSLSGNGEVVTSSERG